MIHRTELYDLCTGLIRQYKLVDGEFLSLVLKLSSTLWYAGSGGDDIRSILRLVCTSYEAGGRRSASILIKGWSNCIRSILSVEPYDTSLVGYCKQARNCRFALRKVGASPEEIDIIINTYDGLCGIPPLLLLSGYWRVLLGNCDLSLLHRIIPLSNLGRACPVADADRCSESESKFYVTTMRDHDYTFDLTKLGNRYGMLCKNASIHSRISLSSHSSFHFSRSAGGKNQEFAEKVIDRFMFKTVDELVPNRPLSDLYDILGNLVLRVDDWGMGVPIMDIFYPTIPHGSSSVDGRLGLFGLLWAIWSLHDELPHSVTSSSRYIAIGIEPPELVFDGSLPSRVCTLAEEGFKARVITIVMLSAAIIQNVARFFIDNSMRTDPLVKIGLLSKVKLYDFLVTLNQGDRRGVVDFNFPSSGFGSAISADLTTATDTPPRRNVLTLLRGYTDSISNDMNRKLIRFAVSIGCSQRSFQSRNKPRDHIHRNGIMMGEGLSGTFLNVMSGIVRTILDEFMIHFDFYTGSSPDDAHDFIVMHRDLFQDFFDTVQMAGFHQSSTQSGDDLIYMTHSDGTVVRRFLILLYVALGLVPSESTFYGNSTYCTFTEEAAIKTRDSIGWTFVDCVKPRLFSITSPDGISSVLSHISQITASIGYLRDDVLTGRACDIVDTMILCNRVIRERCRKYNLVPAFPSWLGGLDHPYRYLDGTEVDVPEEDRSMVMKLKTCSEEDLFTFKYSWALDDLPSESDAAEIRRILKYVYKVFVTLPEGEMSDPVFQDFHTYPERELVHRDLYPTYNSYYVELAKVKNDLGLANLDDIVSYVTSCLKLRLLLDDPSAIEEPHPMMKLRNRREFLLSGTQSLIGDPHDFTWADIKSLDWRMKNSYKGRVVNRDSFLLLVELDDLPSLSVSATNFLEGGYD